MRSFAFLLLSSSLLSTVQAEGEVSEACTAELETLAADTNLTAATTSLFASLTTTPAVVTIAQGADEIDIQVNAGVQSDGAYSTACESAGGEYVAELSHLVCTTITGTEVHVDMAMLLCLGSSCTEEDEHEVAHETLELMIKDALQSSNVTIAECALEAHDDHDHDEHEKSSVSRVGVAAAVMVSLVYSYFL